MNSQLNTTPAPAAARDTAVADAMRDLEHDVCCLVHMARILGDMLDHDLVEFDGDGRKGPSRGQTIKVILGHDQLEHLSFAWNDVINRARLLKDRYYAAFDAGARS